MAKKNRYARTSNSPLKTQMAKAVTGTAGGFPVGTPLNQVNTVPAGQSQNYYNQVSQGTLDVNNRMRQANLYGNMIENPGQSGVGAFQWDNPNVQSMMKEQGKDRNYINSYQPSNYGTTLTSEQTRAKHFVGPPEVPQYGLGGDVAMGAGTGALTGMALGPWGAAAGAVIGGGAALIKGLGDQKDLEEQNQVVGNNPMMGAQNMPTFCRGGKVRKYPYGGYTSPGTAELERGEVYMTPDGNVQRITDKAPKHGQKAKSGNTGVRMDLPEGTKILSNRNIDPMTGRTFADAAAKDSKFRDKVLKAMDKGSKYAREAARLNLSNLDQNFETAYDRQEFAKGGKVKKTSMYHHGGLHTGPRYDEVASQTGNLGYAPSIDYLAGQPGYYGNQRPDAGGMAPNTGQMPEGHQYTQPGGYGSGQPGGAAGFFNQPAQQTNPASATRATQTIDPSTTNMANPFGNNDGIYGSAARQGFQNVGQSLVGQGDPTQISLAGAGVQGAVPGANGAGLGFGQKLQQGLGNLGGSGALGTIAGLAPTIFNTIQGMRKPTQRDPSEFRNPQYNQAINLMANRRFNVEPLLEANRNAAAIGRYNLSGAGASAGQQFSGYQALAAQRMRSDARAYTQKQNIENQYLGQEAQMRAGLGSEEARNLYRTDQDNLAAQASRRTYQGAAASQLSQYTQMQQLMKNQKLTDEQRMNILRTNPYAAQWLGLPS